MPTLTLQDDRKTLRVESDKPLTVNDQPVAEFVRRLEAFDARTPLQSLSVVAAVADAGACVCTFAVLTKDGRTWEQELRLEVGQEPRMTAQAPDLWKNAEVADLGGLRDGVADLVRRYELKTLECTWQ